MNSANDIILTSESLGFITKQFKHFSTKNIVKISTKSPLITN